jgi:hypothetical protein
MGAAVRLAYFVEDRRFRGRRRDMMLASAQGAHRDDRLVGWETSSRSGV